MCEDSLESIFVMSSLLILVDSHSDSVSQCILSFRFWSTIFHVHDYPLTEKMDYFSAGSVVFFNLYSAVVYFYRDVVLFKLKARTSSCNNNHLVSRQQSRKKGITGSKSDSSRNVEKTWFPSINTICLILPFSFTSVMSSIKRLFLLSTRLQECSHSQSSSYADKDKGDLTRNVKSFVNREEDSSQDGDRKVSCETQFSDNQEVPEISGLFYLSLGVPFFSFFVYHIYFLNYRSFDYGYNMIVNLIAGKLMSLFLSCIIFSS